MKIKKVLVNNRKKAFEVTIRKNHYLFPYSRLLVKPTGTDGIAEVHVDRELGGDGFTYTLASGKEGTIVADQVLEYAKDPEYLRKVLLYKLTLQAQRLIAAQGVSKREIIRRLGTSPTQFYRLIDQTFYNKTIDQMVRLLAALDCPVDLVFEKAA